VRPRRHEARRVVLLDRRGARRVILSAPEKDGIATVVHGVNAGAPDAEIISCASIRKAIMTTVHAYTSTQAIVDSPAKKMRRGRAAAANLVPASTGAAIATTKALPQYEGKFNGTAIRAPVPVGSIADITFVTERATTVDEVNGIFRDEAESNRYRGILGVTEDRSSPPTSCRIRAPRSWTSRARRWSTATSSRS
jgi:glyceraldehyde 3-phosphate dehydrogenase